jgi:hypothetical protein
MTTAGDMIQSSLEKMGTYAAGEIMSAADSSRGLTVLNQMMDSWSNERLTCYANLQQSVTLIVNQYQYTIGPGGDINGTRPLDILVSPGTCYVQDSNGNRYNLDVIQQPEWNQIGNINAVTANFPNTLFYDPQFPLGIINIYPIPNISWTLFFISRLQLADLSDLEASLSLPPGYEKAIVDNLTLELIPYFKGDGFQVPPLWMKQAGESKGNVKRTNIRENVASYDPELIAHAPGVYNPYTGSNRGPAQ